MANKRFQDLIPGTPQDTDIIAFQTPGDPAHKQALISQLPAGGGGGSPSSGGLGAVQLSDGGGQFTDDEANLIYNTSTNVLTANLGVGGSNGDFLINGSGIVSQTSALNYDGSTFLSNATASRINNFLGI